MKTIEFVHNGITVKQNPLTGDWFVFPPNNSTPFVVATKGQAKKLIQRMNAGKKV